MSRKKIQEAIITGGTVSLATLGLSTCNDNGAVDPAPPPLNCSTDGTGRTLSGGGTIAGNTLTIQIFENFGNQFTGSSTVTQPFNVTVNRVTTAANMVEVELTLEAGKDTAAFTLGANLQGFDGTRCSVVRTFTVRIQNGAVSVAQLDRKLPLHARTGAAVMLLRREGCVVELAAEEAPAALRRTWEVTAGTLAERSDGGMTWHLPESRGFYMAELVVDYGTDGLSFDTLMLEVS